MTLPLPLREGGGGRGRPGAVSSFQAAFPYSTGRNDARS